MVGKNAPWLHDGWQLPSRDLLYPTSYTEDDPEIPPNVVLGSE